MSRRVVLGAASLLLALLGACSLLTSTDGLDTGARPPGTDSGSAATSADGSSDSSPGLPGDGGGPGPELDGGGGLAYREAVIADTPAAYFRFEDVSGNACVNEVSGSRFNCVYGGSGVSRGAPGVAGSLTVRVVPASTVSMSETALDFSKPFTLEFWLELDTPIPGERIGSSMVNITPSTRAGLTAFLWDTSGAFRTEMWNTNFQNYTLAATPPTANAWHHIVVGHDSTGDFSYFDGAKSSGGDSQDDAGNPKTNVPFVFTGFGGRVDELAWYDHVLSSARILAHYGLN